MSYIAKLNSNEQSATKGIGEEFTAKRMLQDGQQQVSNSDRSRRLRIQSAIMGSCKSQSSHLLAFSATLRTCTHSSIIYNKQVNVAIQIDPTYDKAYYRKLQILK